MEKSYSLTDYPEYHVGYHLGRIASDDTYPVCQLALDTAHQACAWHLGWTLGWLETRK